MSDLTEFLLARVTEDEWDARRALGLDLAVRLKGQAAQVVSRHGSPDPPDEPNAADRLWWTTQDVVQWLAPYGPTRVLAECETVRRVVAQVEETRAEIKSVMPGGSGRLSLLHGLDMIEHHIALPYVDHPAYDEAWRP